MNAMAYEANPDLNLFLPIKTSTVNKLTESAAKIALYNFEWRYITLLFYNSSLICGLEVFVQLYDKSVVIGRGKFEPRFSEQTRQYVLFGSDISNIMHMLQWMQQHKFDNTGKYIVICQSEEDCDETEAVKIFWSHKIVNVVFIKNATNQRKLIEYTYVHPEDCQSLRPIKIINLDNCIKNKREWRKMFPKKLMNLHRCPIVVSTFIQPPYMTIKNGKPAGSDGDLLLILAEGLNATLKIMTPRRGDGWGALGSDGIWSGSLGDVYDDIANFSMTFAAITLSRFVYFQMSIDYNAVTLVWLTHPKEQQPSSMKLLHPLQPATQVCITITFAFVIIMALITKSNFWTKYRRSLKLDESQSSVIFSSWRICMGLPIRSFPKKTALLYIVLLWIWYGFLIRTIYQSSLISSLMNNQHVPIIQTLEEMLQAKYPFGGGPALKDYFIDYPVVYDNWINLNNSSAIKSNMLELSKGLKFGLAVNGEYAKTFRREHHQTLHELREKIVVSPTVLYFKKFSPLTAPIDRVLRRLIEAGFTDKLYRNYAYTYNIKTEDHDDPINMKHYAGCYAILLFGWFLSTMFFFYEFCLVKLKTNSS